MYFSEEIDEFAKAFSKFQSVVESPKKSNENPAFKRSGKAMKYADLDTIIKTVTPKLTECGLSQFQFTSSDVESKTVSVTTIIMHASGQYVRSEPLVLPAENFGKFNAQTVGSAITYGRRYSLSAVLGIASEEDDDANSVTQQDMDAENNNQSTQPQQRQNTENQKLPPNVNEVNDRMKLLIEAIKNSGGDIKNVQKVYLQTMGLPNFDNYSKTDFVAYLEDVLKETNNNRRNNPKQQTLLEGRTTKPAGPNWGE